MHVDKERVKKVLNRLIDEGNWAQMRKLIEALEMQDRNESVIRNALDDVRDVSPDV